MKTDNFYRIFRDSFIDAAIKTLQELKATPPSPSPPQWKKRNKAFRGKKSNG